MYSAIHPLQVVDAEERPLHTFNEVKVFSLWPCLYKYQLLLTYYIGSDDANFVLINILRKFMRRP